MKKLCIALVLLLCIPLATALDCTLVEDQDICEEIQDSELTDEEKKELYLALFYTEFPDYDYVEDYNLEIEFDEAPEGVVEYDSSYIKNAWMKIVAVSPSLIINHTLFHNGEGEILLGYNYDIETPSGTASGDCRTSYNVRSISTSFEVSDDGTTLGYSDLVSFSVENNLYLEAEMEANVRVEIRHYKWETEEYQYYIGGRIYYRDVCRYSHTETDYDSLTVTDDLELEYYSDEPSYSLEILDEAYDSYKGSLEVEDETTFELSFIDSYYENRDWYYSYEYSYEPYYILTVVAEEYEKEVSENININSEGFTVGDIEDCSITLYNHFESETYDCSTEYEDVDIEISISEQFYEKGDTIEVSIEPSDVEVLLTYGDLEEYITGSTSLEAFDSGLITISYNSKEDSEMLYVGAEEWDSFWNFGWFGTFLYMISNFSMFIWRKVGI
jgi:hypothetical protein